MRKRSVVLCLLLLGLLGLAAQATAAQRVVLAELFTSDG